MFHSPDVSIKIPVELPQKRQPYASKSAQLLEHRNVGTTISPLEELAIGFLFIRRILHPNVAFAEKSRCPRRVFHSLAPPSRRSFLRESQARAVKVPPFWTVVLGLDQVLYRCRVLDVRHSFTTAKLFLARCYPVSSPGGGPSR